MYLTLVREILFLSIGDKGFGTVMSAATTEFHSDYTECLLFIFIGSRKYAAINENSIIDDSSTVDSTRSTGSPRTDTLSTRSTRGLMLLTAQCKVHQLSFWAATWTRVRP